MKKILFLILSLLLITSITYAKSNYDSNYFEPTIKHYGNFGEETNNECRLHFSYCSCSYECIEVIPGEIILDCSMACTVSPIPVYTPNCGYNKKGICEDLNKKQDTCTDSDNGKNYYQKGTLTEKGIQNADYCINSKKLKEFYCVNKNKSGKKTHVCKNGCYNGACISK